MTAAGVRFAGSSRLVPALAAAARRMAVPFDVVDPSAAPAMLGAPSGEVAIGLDQDLPAVLFRHAFGAVLRALSLAPRQASAVVLAPAAGVCGPAGHGPVNAVRVGGAVTVELGPAHRVPVNLQVLVVQQTGCWVAACTVHGVADAPAEPLPGDDVELMPACAATDTAKVCEYMQDRGLGDDWPHIVLLGEPKSVWPDGLQVLFAYTEGGYARHLVREALGSSGGAGARS